MQRIPIYPLKSRSRRFIRSLIKTMMVSLALLNLRKWWTVKIPINTFLIRLYSILCFYLHLFFCAMSEICAEKKISFFHWWCEVKVNLYHRKKKKDNANYKHWSNRYSYNCLIRSPMRWYIQPATIVLRL